MTHPRLKLDDTYKCESDYDMFFIATTPDNIRSPPIKKELYPTYQYDLFFIRDNGCNTPVSPIKKLDDSIQLILCS